jgi:general secretion pathway protein J
MNTRNRGFTLIELLVAIFIAGLMFAMGYGALSQGLKNHETLKDQQERLKALQTTVRLLEQDFVQLTPRPVRQAVGDEPAQPALQSGTPGTQPVVSLTRNGWANPRGLQRPGLQRVAYLVEDGTLKREHWTVLDPTLASTTVKRELLSHVKSLTIRYMDANRQWQEQWPPPTVAGVIAQETNLRLRPIAVEVTLDTEDWGTIVRLFEVAG